VRTSYDQSDVRRTLGVLCKQIAAAFAPEAPLCIVGVRSRGETLAQRVAAELQTQGFNQIERGVLDVTLYRDDLSERGGRPVVRPTDIPGDIQDKQLLLVDDVLFTGRSVRAALDALNDFGRPAAIRLAVLVDRGGRELPIQADFVGITMRDVPADHRVNVHFLEDDQVDEIVVEPRG